MASLTALLNTTTPFPESRPLGYDVFGKGMFRPFYYSGTFIVPSGVTSVRARVVGGGGGSNTSVDSTSPGGGGGGGGFAMGIIEVTPGQSITVTVGGAGSCSSNPSAGGTSSFGAFLTATGGSPGTKAVDNAPGGVGGTGTGGDFTASGGSGGAGIIMSGTSEGGGGGGAAGSPLGDGGNGGDVQSNYGGGGGGVGGNHANGLRRNGPYGIKSGSTIVINILSPDPLGTAVDGVSVYSPRFPFDMFTGNPSGAGGTSGSNQASLTEVDGGDGGGGGGMYYTDNDTSLTYTGDAGIGGGSGADASTKDGSLAGPGIVVVEW